MTTVSHEPPRAAQRQGSWSQVLVPEMWASLTIIVIWLSVLFDAVFGPDIVNIGVAGDHSTVPSAVVVALFAFLATWVVAKVRVQHRSGGVTERAERRSLDDAPTGAEPDQWIGSTGRSSPRQCRGPR